jgi:hypothetical protein
MMFIGDRKQSFLDMKGSVKEHGSSFRGASHYGRGVERTNFPGEDKVEVH